MSGQKIIDGLKDAADGKLSRVTIDRKTWVLEKDTKAVRQSLKLLTEAVGQYLAAIDKVMERPESVDRGGKVARLSNALEMANDKARYFGLGIDFRTDKKLERTAPTSAKPGADG